MGNAAELCASTYNLSREDQDAYATQSYKRAAAAWAEGRFKDETFEISVPVRGKDPIVIKEDEDYTKVIFEKMGQLKPVFEKAGTVTAANASNLNDGSAAIVLASRSFAEANGYKPLAIIRGFADAAQAPEWFTTAPAKAIPLALHRAGLTAEDIDFYEINEAFSAVCLANNQLLGLNDSKVNVNGGAVAIGHPLGSSGARIITTLLHVLSQNNARYGVAGICNGGGGASAIVLERV
jgi:acetyl-CoA C-acetyltransferase